MLLHASCLAACAVPRSAAVAERWVSYDQVSALASLAVGAVGHCTTVLCDGTHLQIAALEPSPQG